MSFHLPPSLVRILFYHHHHTSKGKSHSGSYNSSAILFCFTVSIIHSHYHLLPHFAYWITLRLFIWLFTRHVRLSLSLSPFSLNLIDTLRTTTINKQIMSIIYKLLCLCFPGGVDGHWSFLCLYSTRESQLESFCIKYQLTMKGGTVRQKGRRREAEEWNRGWYLKLSALSCI